MPQTRFGRFWSKLPLVVRALLLGFAISTLGVMSWPVVAILVPMPYAFGLMLLLVAAYIAYFSGSGPPRGTADFRRFQFRDVKIPSRLWRFALPAALLIVLIEQSALVVTFRLIPFPAEQFTAAYPFLDQVPPWTAWLVMIMISLVAAIAEETGFRGYMQRPLEERYGPAAGIAVVSVIFVLVHLHQAWSGPLIVHIFFMSVIFGLIAWATGSLIPGMIAHFTMDICNFAFWWSTVGWQFDRRPVNETGMDLHLFVWAILFLASLAAFVLLIRGIRKMKAGG